MARLNRVIQIAFALVLASTLASCEPPAPQNTAPPIQAGTVAVFKISGRLYQAEVTHAKDGYVLWSYKWKGQPFFKQKTYRGLLGVYDEEGGFKNWNTFDQTVIDNFFPIEVGNEISLTGQHHSQRDGTDYPLAVTISVRGETTIAVEETVYRVFVLDYLFTEERPEGDKSYVMTAWFSGDLETALRTDFAYEGKTLSMLLVSLDGPDGLSEEREPEPDLGTIRL